MLLACTPSSRRLRKMLSKTTTQFGAPRVRLRCGSYGGRQTSRWQYSLPVASQTPGSLLRGPLLADAVSLGQRHSWGYSLFTRATLPTPSSSPHFRHIHCQLLRHLTLLLLETACFPSLSFPQTLPFLRSH